MRRREFVAALLIPWCVEPAIAEQKPRICILHSGFPNRTPIEDLYDALRLLGYESGRTADIELLSGEGDPSRLNSLVAALVKEQPNVIIALTSPAVVALKHARVAAPVVFAFVADPIGLGLIDSLAHPGGNYTGVTFSEAFLGGKRLEILAEAVPGVRMVAVLWSSSFPENAAIAESVRKFATPLGIKVFMRELRGLNDLAPAFDDAVRAGAQGVVFLTDNTLFGQRRAVAELALKHRLPSMHSFAPEVRDGGFLSFGPNLRESYRRAAALADRVLKGVPPSDLPVEEPVHFTLSINMKTAAALGLTIPPSLLARADEVIE